MAQPAPLYIWKGLTPYAEALALQQELWMRSVETGESFVLGLEHPSVITLGRRAQVQEEVAFGASIPAVQIDRGGQATLHSPGQLVIYPIVNIRQRGLGVRDFVHGLHLSIQAMLKTYGIETSLKCEQPGVYTKKGKIAFVGIRVEKGVSRHGISINVNNDLSLFSQIRSCGIQAAALDRVCDAVPECSVEKAWEQFRFGG